MKDVVVLSGAQAHVLSIYRRLEDAAEGRGDAFYDDFLAGCRLLEDFPEIAPRYRSVFRKLLLSKWHVGVFYSIVNSRVMVSAVMDLRQDPMAIQRYLDSL